MAASSLRRDRLLAHAQVSFGRHRAGFSRHRHRRRVIGGAFWAPNEPPTGGRVRHQSKKHLATLKMMKTIEETG
jgi:hypothetical protein